MRFHPLRFIRSLYDWVMAWAEKPRAAVALALLATAESVFFPVPVDPFLMAMGAARPQRAIYYGLLASFFSVLGGVLGYAVGYWFWDVSQDFFYSYVFSKEGVDLVLAKFQENAFLAIFLAAFTPIPYKVFTIAAGIAHLAWAPFMVGSILGRGIRFTFEGALLYFFGPRIRSFIETYFEKITAVCGLLIVLGILFYKYLHSTGAAP